MLQLRDIQYTIEKDGAELRLLDRITFHVPRGHFMAIVGPSGCGKSTLLKTIAGINVETDGDLFWKGRNLSEEGDLEPQEFGYVPQFSIAYDVLTVEESIDNAIRLRLRTRGRKEMERISDRILEQTGLDTIRERRVGVLSGGQRRRLGLALELATNPDLLLCDEVTSGLDPKSETEIVHLLHQLAKSGNRVVLSVTHSLGNLELYDSVLVLHEGRLVYHGSPQTLNHYFGVQEAEDVYPALGRREPAEWQTLWETHRDSYYAAMPSPAPAEVPTGPMAPESNARVPGMLTQLFVLLRRRWQIFFRDRTQLTLQFLMLVIFPLIVVLFAYEGLPDLKRPSDTLAGNPTAELLEQMSMHGNRLKVGGLISGLVMFQVVLLALMGSNNSAREIAGERQIFEKEKLGGLNLLSYLGSKAAFLSVLVVLQSVWMYYFVAIFARMPTDFLLHPLLLILVNAAMSALCLGISASMQSPDQASLLSIYLVGFQLPLSGAVLALPKVLEPAIQPFISAYWSWSGIVSSLEPRFYNAVDVVTDATLRPTLWCAGVLLAHLLAGTVLAIAGAGKVRWSH